MAEARASAAGDRSRRGRGGSCCCSRSRARRRRSTRTCCGSATSGQRDVFWTRLWSEWAIGLVFGAVAFVARLRRTSSSRGAWRPPCRSVALRRTCRCRRSSSPAGARRRSATVARAGHALGRCSACSLLRRVGVGRVDGGRLGDASGSRSPRCRSAASTRSSAATSASSCSRCPALRLVVGLAVRRCSCSRSSLTAVVHVFDGAIRPWERLRGLRPAREGAPVGAGRAHRRVARRSTTGCRIFELDFSPRGQVTRRVATPTCTRSCPRYYDPHRHRARVRRRCCSSTSASRAGGCPPSRSACGSARVGARRRRLPGARPAVPGRAERGRRRDALHQAQHRRRRARPSASTSIVTRPFAGERRTSPPQDVVGGDRDDRATSGCGTRTWSSTSYKQLQEIRPYYDFNDVDIDRYVIDGRAAAGARLRARDERRPARRPGEDVGEPAPRLHARLRRGGEPGERGRRRTGLPVFLVQDIPPKTDDRPQDHAPGDLLRRGDERLRRSSTPTQKEFDYPVGGAERRRRATPARAASRSARCCERLAFALRFGATEILLSSCDHARRAGCCSGATSRSASARSRRGSRSTATRTRCSPTGGIVWILDGYTSVAATTRTRSATASADVNYIRNSVKVTVDAYDGTTTLYAFDEKDPMLAAWRTDLPGPRSTDASKMPEDDPRRTSATRGPLPAAGRGLQDLPHARPAGLLQQGGPVGASRARSSGDAMAPFYVLMRAAGRARARTSCSCCRSRRATRTT